MVNIAVLGYGVVGSGVVEVVKRNSTSISQRAGKKIMVKKILDVRDFPDSPDQELLTKNAEDVFGDESINIIVETIGGAKIAYEFTKRALAHGKHVVTSNKELVAAHGPELLQLALDNGVFYLFEASVGGGIPIIRPLYQCLAANEIHGITGILNGTTNYILTCMRKDGMDFHEALRGAQKNGYAEADPTADIEGHDTCRKIAILSSIAYNEYVNYKYIPTEGIKNITLKDMQYADEMDSVIKLLAVSRKLGDRIYARVYPAIVSKRHPLSNVEDVFNAIVVSGDAIGDAMFYGRGAGKLPTASAVVADIIDIVKNHGNTKKSVQWFIKQENNLIDPEDFETRFFIRAVSGNVKEIELQAAAIFGKVTRVRLAYETEDTEFAFLTEKEPERNLKEKITKLCFSPDGIKTAQIIRVLE